MVPFFAVRQVGFMATNTKHNSSLCLRFLTPKYAIINNNTWYMLDTPSQCPVFGRVMICQDIQYELWEFSQCLRIANVSSVQCPLAQCTDVNYISTPAGITTFLWIRRIIQYIMNLYKKGKSTNRKVVISDNAPGLIKHTKSIMSVSSRRASQVINNQPQELVVQGGVANPTDDYVELYPVISNAPVQTIQYIH